MGRKAVGVPNVFEIDLRFFHADIPIKFGYDGGAAGSSGKNKSAIAF
jgi:hypothetical protein